MKKTLLLLLPLLLVFTSCKKDHVDASTTQSFQSSINDMTSSLPTIKQIKFNEALYILKTFGVEADGDANELKALGTLLDGKKIPEIFAMADQVAQKNGIDWSSTGPPSLGEMNIFENVSAKESDPNDIKANSLSLITKTAASDSILGVKAIQIIPRLVDRTGNPIVFEGATLETTMEVFSNGIRLLTSKNLMQDNNFKGFTLKYASLPAQKIIDNKIDISVSVKTTEKTFKMSKIGVDINSKALLTPVVEKPQTDEPSDETINGEPDGIDLNTEPTTTAAGNGTATAPKDPKATVTKFLSNLNSQNLKAAYDASSNPNWGSFDKFSNPTSGFGAVKNLSVKNISTKSTSDNAATVNAVYDVTDKNGKTTPLSVTFGLKNVNGEWKISSYKIN